MGVNCTCVRGMAELRVRGVNCSCIQVCDFLVHFLTLEEKATLSGLVTCLVSYFVKYDICFKIIIPALSYFSYTTDPLQ